MYSFVVFSFFGAGREGERNLSSPLLLKFLCSIREAADMSLILLRGSSFS